MKHAATLQWKGIGVLCKQNKVPKVHVAIINRISYASILLNKTATIISMAKQPKNHVMEMKVTVIA